MKNHFTVFGSTGFIGSELSKTLAAQGFSVKCPIRDDENIFKHPLGHVIYAAGIVSCTQDMLEQTVEAHITKPLSILKYAHCDSFLYLSTVRVYAHSQETHEETPIPGYLDHNHSFYDVSKMMGERICLEFKNPKIRIARLANVLGNNKKSNTFTYTLLKNAWMGKNLTIDSNPDNKRDYVMIDDVVSLIPHICQSGRYRLYNIASGISISNQQLGKVIKEVTGCSVSFSSEKPLDSWPPISISRIKEEFSFRPSNPLDHLKDVLHILRKDPLPV